MTPLCEIAAKYDTDKGPTGQNATLGVFPGHGYTATYDQMFARMRPEFLALCEIGVWSGGSMHMWADYFTRAELIGLDVDFSRLDDWAKHTRRVRWHHCDQSDAVALASASETFAGFTITIDDGSHIPEHMTVSLGALWPHTIDWYIIEDTRREHLPAFAPQWNAITNRMPVEIPSALSPDVVALAWRR